MMKNRRRMLIACILLMVTACSENNSQERGNKIGEPGKKIEQRSGAKTIRIVFRLGGDDIGSPEHRDIMEKIKNSIVSSGAGAVVRSGYGMGTMEIVIRTSIEQPKEELSLIVLSQFPKANYRIEELKE
jgi:hypothetical protein